MLELINQVKSRNETLYYFGLVCFLFAVLCILLTRLTKTQVNNTSAWFKPFKFAFSTFLYAWTMAWYCYYLPGFNARLFDWSIIVLLGFEIIYIAIQASRGQLSHYNVSTAFYAFLYSVMALAASLATIYTAYIGWLFFTKPIPDLPTYYVWAIRFGVTIFVLFSFQGFVMGSKLRHTIGGDDGSPGIPIVNWSKLFGDLRIAHFIGMHALQVLPFLSYYVFKSVAATFIISLFYLLLAANTLRQALKGKPLITSK